MNRYVLDTSALLTLIENEEGAEEVEVLLGRALEGQVELFISVISCIEIFYLTWREQGKGIAEKHLEFINNLPIAQEALIQELAKIIVEIKATKTMSFAGSCIAGLSSFKNAILVHKSPEFKRIENRVKQYKLPSKHNRHK